MKCLLLLSLAVSGVYAAPFVVVPTMNTSSCAAGAAVITNLVTTTTASQGCSILGTGNTAVGAVGYADFYANPTPYFAAGSDVEVNDLGAAGQITSVSRLDLLTNTSSQMGLVKIDYSAQANVFSGSGSASLSLTIDGQTVLNCVLSTCQSGSVSLLVPMGDGNIFDLILTQTSQAGNGTDVSALASTGFSANLSFFDLNGATVTATVAPAPEPATLTLVAFVFGACAVLKCRR